MWRRTNRDMQDEMESHIAARADHLVSQGKNRADALRQARLEFGAVANYREEGREAKGLRLFDELAQDFRYTWRQFRRAPLYAILAVALLGLGIGANTAVFSAIEAILLRTLPVKDPHELRHLEWTSSKPRFHRSYNGTSFNNAAGERIGYSVSYPVYRYMRDHSTQMAGLIAYSGSTRVALTIQGHAVLANAEAVSGNFFDVLGTDAIIGRALLPEDDRPSAAPAIVLSHGFWQRVFASNPAVLGQTIALNGLNATVVGVLPKAFCGVNPAICRDAFVPLTMEGIAFAQPDSLDHPDRWAFELIGRLKPGAQDETARVELEVLMRQAILDYKPKEEYVPPRVRLNSASQGLDRLRTELASPLKILAWSSGVLLFIVCTNLAGVLLARATSRQREIGTRLALGAGPGRLMRQLLTESITLSLLGGAVGVLIAYWLGAALPQWFHSDPRPLGVQPGIDARVLAFSIALCLLAGVLFGIAPALRAARVDVITALRLRLGSAIRSNFRTGKLLVTVQVALSLALITGCALFVRTLIKLNSQELGIQSSNLLIFQLNATLNGYKEQRLLDFHESVLKRLLSLPGVQSASFSRWGILSGSASSDGVKKPGTAKSAGARMHYVAPAFISTMGMKLIAGRDVSWADRENAPLVILLNERLARELFPNQNAVGEILDYNGRTVTVAGVVSDAKFDALRQAPPPTIFVPFRQHPQHVITYVLKTALPPRYLIAAARKAVEEIDPNVPLHEIRTQAEQINQQMLRERTFAALLAAFGVLALILTSIGIYGTLAYLVARRTSEIGVRMALGARAGEVIRMILRESLAPVVVGVAIGLAIALAGGSLIEKMLFGVEPRDPISFVTAVLVLLFAAAIASWIPAAKAARIAPMQALRHD